jgi:hypothetical protein
MDLQSARSLKSELREFLASDSLGTTTDNVGLGIAPTSKHRNYVIAVRAPSEGVLPEELRKELRARTANEIDIRITGEITMRLPVTPPASKPRPRLPSRFNHELRGTGDIRGVGPSGRLKIGASVGHYRVSAGTLGFFAQRNDDGVIGIVSNNHILAAGDEGGEGDAVLHPALADRGETPRDTVALLSGAYPRLRDGAGVDCAFAVLLQPKVPHDPAELPLDQRLQSTPAPLDGQRAVSKIGRTTMLTYGHITAFELDKVDVDYSFGTTRFVEQLEIESSTHGSFTLPGDSGSLIVGPGGHALGLVFATARIGGAWKSGLTYAHPMDTVLRALNVSLLV